MGMKILIILSLAAICLANRRKHERKAFLFPGQPSSRNASHTLIWSEFGNLGSLNPERSQNYEKSSEESGMVLSNPNRRDVKLGGGFPGFGFQGTLKQVQSENLKNKAPIKSENPSFIENTTPVLEKEKSSSSEESNAIDDKEEEFPSEDNIQSVSKSESPNEETNTANSANPEVSSSEENNELAVNQEDSSSEENNASIAEGKESPSEDTNAPNTNQNAPKQEYQSVKYGFLPFLGANALARKNRIRDVDSQRPKSAKRVRVSGYRPLRSAEFNIPDLGINLNNEGSRKVQAPQGGINAKKQNKRVRRPFKQ